MTRPLRGTLEPDTKLDRDSPPPATRRLRINAHGLTDPGRVRPDNEDQFLVASLTHALKVRETSLPQGQIQCGKEEAHLLAVADGMGGHPGGRQASALAVHCLEQYVPESLNGCLQGPAQNEERLLEEFRKAVIQADARMFRESRRQP